MRRRELIAGIAGVGIVTGGGVLATRGPLSLGTGGPAGTRSDPDDAAEDTSDGSDDGSSDGSADGDADGSTNSDDDRSANGSGDGSPAQPAVETFEVETVDAPGSDAGTVSVPDLGQVTFVDFFATWCGPCEAQMPELAKAAERVSDDVTFLSVTNETLPEDEIVDWWDEHGGNWTLGIDPTAEVLFHYGVTQIPTAVVIDANGAVQWSHAGTTEADVFVDQIEAARDQG